MLRQPRVAQLTENPTMSNAMTVDVEDYFHTEAMSQAVPRDEWDRMPVHVQRNTERLFELFASRGVRGTFFFLGWVAERFPALVQQAARLGHEIGCHSYWHRPIYRLSPSEFREDTVRAKRVIEDAAGVPVNGYRAPSFSLTPGTEWAAEILAEAGFRYDSSLHPIRHDLYDNHAAPRTPHHIGQAALVEIPIATVQIGSCNLPVAGGGYFRALPYSYVRWGLRRLNRREGQPAVFYIHSWEIDTSQPRISANLKSRVRQYVGLSKTWHKLDRLFTDFHFGPLAEIFRLDLNAASNPNAGTSVASQQATLNKKIIRQGCRNSASRTFGGE